MPVTFNFRDMLSARSVMGDTINDLGNRYDNVWALTPDIGQSLNEFRAQHPERFIDVGIAEQNCMTVAAGLAYEGAVPIVVGMGMFLTMRAFEQCRTDIGYPNLPVRIIATHGGMVSGGGSTHYMIEDVALMTSIVNMTVTAVSDPTMVRDLLERSMDLPGPLYIRLSQGKADQVLYQPGEHEIRIGGSITARQGGDVTLLTYGELVAQSLDAAEVLARDGIQARVIDMYTLKPVDRQAILDAAEQTGRIVVVEDHLAYGGLASIVSDTLIDAGAGLTAFRRLGIPQVYAGFGSPDELRDKHGFGLDATVEAVRRLF
ncbi:MAG TPA: transketolase C-terminal domain-containing protein [Cellulomonas sp.]